MITLEKQGAVTVLRPNGPIDSASCDELRKSVLGGLAAGRPMVVVDCNAVPLIDNNGLETLLDLKAALESRGGAMKLAAVNSLCYDIFRVTGVDLKFEQHAFVRSAVGSFAE